MTTSSIVESFFGGNLVLGIAIGIAAGVLLALIWPAAGSASMLFGTLIVLALKAIAPALVLVLVAAAIVGHQSDQQTHSRSVIVLYLIGTLCAAFVAVLMSSLFPTTLALSASDVAMEAPEDVGDVLDDLLYNLVDNPINALMNGNYIGILVWGVAIGLTMRRASDTPRGMLIDLSHALTRFVRFVIRLAPLGIFGLVAGIWRIRAFPPWPGMRTYWRSCSGPWLSSLSSSTR